MKVEIKLPRENPTKFHYFILGAALAYGLFITVVYPNFIEKKDEDY